MKKGLNTYKIIVFFSFFCIYIFPSYFLENLTGIDITKYIFLIGTSIIYFGTIYNTTVTKTEVTFFAFIILICFIQKSIEPLHLIELIVLYKMVDNVQPIKKKLKNNYLLFLSLVGVLIYSVIYFGFVGRYIYTGIREINQSGFAIFMLFIIIRKKNKKIGNLLLILGLLSFSRNYMVCLIAFMVLERLKNTRIYNKLYKFFDFNKLLIISFIILIGLSFAFDVAYQKNELVEYQTGLQRYISLFDYSNYFRFSTNTKLLKIYYKHPEKLLTGIEENEFYDLSYEISLKEGTRYRRIKPHNYFFSYLRIYGIFSLGIFILLKKIINKVIDRENYLILIILFLYANILGIGFANYWLYLSIFAMIAYKGDIENE